MPENSDRARKKRGAGGPIWALAAFSLLVAVFKLTVCFREGVFHSWDLHAHAALCGRLREQLLHGRIAFFDPWWFGGWPAFTFYAPAGHLLAAVLSYLLGFFKNDPVQLSVQVLTGVALATLPLAIFSAARALSAPDGGSSRALDWWLAGFSAIYGLWFLRHPAEHFGIGATAGIELGLFPQVLAWPVFLFYFGELFRTVHRRDAGRFPLRLSLLVACLGILHSMTLVFALSVGAAAMLWYRADRRAWFSHLMGLGFIAAWLLPAAILGGAFAPVDKLPASGSVFTLLFPQSAAQIAAQFRIAGPGTLSLLPLLSVLACLAMLSGTGEAQKRIAGWAAIAACPAIVLSSNYFGTVFPLSLHQYRILVLFVLLLLPVFISSLAVFCCSFRRSSWLAVPLAILAVQEWRLFQPQAESTERSALFREEAAVFAALKPQEKGEESSRRVFFEHLGRPELKNVRSPHYLASRLEAETGRETANGLFIQSSLSQAYPAFAAKRLRIHSYNVRQPIGLSQDSDDELLYARLREFGISDLVLNAADETAGRPGDGAVIGRYRLVHLSGGQPATVKESLRVPIGYRDEAGTLAFRDFEAIFYGSNWLWRNFSLWEIGRGDSTPPELQAIVVNAFENAERKEDGRPLIVLSLPQSAPSRKLRGEEEKSRLELGREEFVLAALAASPALSGLVSGAVGGSGEGKPAAKAEFDIGRQQIRLSNLTPGRPVRIAYSYFPFWKADGGKILRGAAERMWFIPESASGALSYSPRAHPAVQGGYFITALSFVLLLRRLRCLRRLRSRDCISSSDSGTSGN